MAYWYFQSVPLANIFYRTIKQITFFLPSVVYTQKKDCYLVCNSLFHTIGNKCLSSLLAILETFVEAVLLTPPQATKNQQIWHLHRKLGTKVAYNFIGIDISMSFFSVISYFYTFKYQQFYIITIIQQ